jgi:hypothetical protein
MASALQIIAATVKYTAGTPRNTERGPRINVVVNLPDGTEHRLWGDPGVPVLTPLKKGQSIQLAWDGRSYKLVGQPQSQQDESPIAPAQESVHNHTEWTPDQKRALASRIEERAKLMRFCLEQARKHCGEYLESSEDLRAIATTLFLEALKR